jgi:type II secretory pathway predicted ATPase ExeA
MSTAGSGETETGTLISVQIQPDTWADARLTGGHAMNENYRTFFGSTREPFASDLALKEILQTAELTGVQKRFDYALRLGGIGLVTGEIGSGKSTALR